MTGASAKDRMIARPRREGAGEGADEGRGGDEKGGEERDLRQQAHGR